MSYLLFTFKISEPEYDILNYENDGLEKRPLDQPKCSLKAPSRSLSDLF